MFAGHLGIALAATRLAPRVPLGVLAVASMALDIVLWVLVLLGVESVEIPADFVHTHQPVFVFPYSHGLAAALAWSLAAGVLFAMARRRSPPGAWRAAGIVGAVVFSHWLLDVLVHRPEMPLAGAQSMHLGLSLWNALPAALLLEAGLVLAGLVLFWADPQRRREPSRGRARPVAVVVVMAAVTTFTALGMTVAPPPPSAMAMAASSLGTLLLVCACLGWLGRSAPAVRPGPGA